MLSSRKRKVLGDEPIPTTISHLTISHKFSLSDFSSPCIDLAKNLLGKVLCRKLDNGSVLKGRVVETECYLGISDKASHSYNGRQTERNSPMYMQPGTSYVYFTYGMYHCFNISSQGEGAAVLLRAVEPLEGIEEMRALRQQFNEEMNIRRQKAHKKMVKELKLKELCNGPSKLCISFNIDKSCNKQDLCNWENMWVESDGSFCSGFTTVQCPRIGIDSAGQEAANKPLRFYILGNEFVSKRDKSRENKI